MARKRLPALALQTIIIGAAFLILGLALIVAPVLFEWNSTTQLLLSSIGSALVSLAVVSLAAEYSLKVTVAHEMRELAGLNQRTYESGLEELNLEGDFDWASAFKAPGHISFIASKPEHVGGHSWQKVFQLAQTSPCQVEINLISPTSRGMGVLSARSGENAAALSAQVVSFTDKITREWKAAKIARRLNPESRLTIYYLENDPGHSIAQTPTMYLLMLDAPLTEAGSTDLICLSFRKRDGMSQRAPWLKRAFEDLPTIARTIEYTDARQTDDKEEVEHLGA
jgi:hypothetical protein